MNKELYFKLGKSLVITIIIAASIAFALSSLIGSFLGWFVLFFVLQFLVFYIVGEIFKIKKQKSLLEQDYKNKELLTWQNLNVQCPCDKKIESLVPVKLNKENTYLCPGCNKNVKINIETSTVLVTNPINTDIIQSPIFADQINHLIAKTDGN